MAKVIAISADDSRLHRITMMIEQHGGHFVQVARAEPAQALAQPGLTRPADLLVIEAPAFAANTLELLRTRLQEQPETHCVLVTENPSADILMRAMRSGVRCVLPWPLDAKEFDDEMERAIGQNSPGSRKNGKILSFLSSRGGSGTTTIATNLGYTLAATRKKRVLLIDLNQHYGDAAFLVTDRPPPATLTEICQQIDRMDTALLDACITRAHADFDVIAAAGDPVKAAEVKASHIEHIVSLVRPQYDIVLFDLGQSINPATIFALDHSELIYPVLQPNLPSLRSGHKLIDICHSLGYQDELLRLVANRVSKHGPVSVGTLSEAMGMKVAHALPDDPQHATDANTQGLPILQLSPNCPLSRALLTMADSLYPPVANAHDGLLSKLFGGRGRTGALQTIRQT